jgi:transmembrane sensor
LNNNGQRRETNLSVLEDEAVEWVQKVVSGDAAPEEIAAALRWRSLSPAHAAAYAAAERVWKEIDATGGPLHGSRADYVSALDALGKKRRINRRAVLGGGVVTVAATSGYLLLDPPLKLWPSLAEINADYRTGTGEQRDINFGSNIAINLNTQTSLAIRPATTAEDRIELIAGEASFAPSTRGVRSLAVIAAAGRAVAEGGRFDVRFTAVGARTPVSVTCLDGAVRIEHGTGVVDLKRGQRVHYDVAGLSQIAAVDPNVASEWQRGIVEFRDAPLAEAIAEINRYRPGRIVLVSAALGEKRINGRFRVGQMDKVLLQLEQAFSAKLRRLPGGIVLLS